MTLGYQLSYDEAIARGRAAIKSLRDFEEGKHPRRPDDGTVDPDGTEVDVNAAADVFAADESTESTPDDEAAEGERMTPQQRIAEIRARLATDEARRALNLYERRYGPLGGVEKRYLPLVDEDGTANVKLRDKPEELGDASIAAEGSFIVSGYASVFNRKSLDLGGFQEIIKKGAFTDVLDRNPDTALVPDHDLGKVLARTNRNPYQLDLREDPRGLHFYARVIPTTDAVDLKMRMKAGLVDQSSFAFTVDEDEWDIRTIDGDEVVVRTVTKVRDLFDVTITAFGAYPQTNSKVVRDAALLFAQNGEHADSTQPEDRDADPDPETHAQQAETPEEPAVTPDEVREGQGLPAQQDEGRPATGASEQDSTSVAPGTAGESGADPSHDEVVGGDQQERSVIGDRYFDLRERVRRHRHDLGVERDGSPEGAHRS